MNKLKALVLSVSVIAVVSVTLWFSKNDSISEYSKNVQAVNDSVTALPLPASEKEGGGSNAELVISDEKKLKAAKIKFLRGQYGAKIDNPYWQIKMIDQLMRLMKKEFPLSWESELIRLFHEVFPEYAEELTKKLYAHIEYIAWIDSLKNNLTFENRDDRRQALWDKRLELFGDEAYEIWEAALKQDKFDAHMQALAQSADSFNEKTEQYIVSMKEVFGENALQAGHKTQMINHFLSLENVQNDLRNMPVEERSAQLRNYRESMGLDDAALTRWDSLDHQRDLMRETGTLYMDERNRLAQTYEGDALSDKVKALQIDAFGETEAKVIYNEEQSGYYRYNAPQKFGFN